MAKNKPIVLEMIDWRGCPVVEYVPTKVSGRPSFINMRMPVDILVDWVENGQNIGEFERSFHVGEHNIKTALKYLYSNPPVHVVDLTGCSAIDIGPDGRIVFKGTSFPVEILFNHIKGGVSPAEFCKRYGLDDGQIMAVLTYDTDLVSVS